MLHPDQPDNLKNTTYAPKDDTLADIESALDHVDPEDRDTWVRVGMAIKAGLGDAGFAVWDDWSQRAANYSAAAAETTWRSFKDGGVDLPTLFFLAKENGWQGSTTPARSLTPEEVEARRLARARQDQLAQAERAHRQTQAAANARAIYEAASLDPAGHPYAAKKRLRFPESVRRGPWPQRKWADALLVPLYDESGQIRTLQAIDADGTKDLLAGGQKRGCFFPLGNIRGTDRVLVGEGLATVAAGCLAVDCPGVMAVDAGNLLSVGQVVRRLVGPAASIIFLADDDLSQEARQ